MPKSFITIYNFVGKLQMRQILNDFQTLCHERVLLLQMHELKQGLEKKLLKSISNIPMQGGCQTVEKNFTWKFTPIVLLFNTRVEITTVEHIW